MANINDAFPSSFLKVEDLQGRNVTVTIASAQVKEIGQGRDKDRKIVIGLVGKQKEFVCNKTNAKTIGSFYGPETNDWVGKPITLCPREVEFQGSMVMAIRVSLQRPGASGVVMAPPVQAAPPPRVVPAAAPINDEDVPF